MASNLTDEGRRVVADVAARHGFSIEATTTLLNAVAAGYGTQAQFSHPEFGGMGQWSAGGMIMIGDMFNNALAGRVASLCQELSGLVQSQQMFFRPAQSQSQSQGFANQSQAQGMGGDRWTPSFGGEGASLFVSGASSSNWWPADLGSAGSTGAQNSVRYAYFPAARRLAIDVNGVVTVYDTGEHLIGGFSQQQSGDQSITFTSQFGHVRLSDLAVVSGAPLPPPSTVVTPMPTAPAVTAPIAEAPIAVVPSAPVAATPVPVVAAPIAAAPVASTPMPTASVASGTTADDVFGLIEKLAALHAKGILTDEEFGAKKTELLGRL
jgi:hypothetical protein